ncbi:MAG TPA: hypothetical protein VFQ54_12610 [Thermomicrobiales bacterium]|nr:hypothetical protein [Thermomicrobiales bacterium]
MRNATTPAREYATDCLAWHVDAPSAASFLTGSLLNDAIYSAAAASGINLRRAENIATIPGLGVTARVDGKFVAIGIAPLFATLDIRIEGKALGALSEIRLAGNDAILVGSWKGIDHVCAIANPSAVAKAA